MLSDTLNYKMDDAQTHNQININDENSRDTYVNKLLKAIDDIGPNKLGDTSYVKYIKQLSEILIEALRHDNTCLIYILESVKNCKKPCYKRDVLLEILNKIFISPKSIISQLLCDTFYSNSTNVPWKILANSISTLPDVVANNNALRKFPGFRPEEFFSSILVQLYDAIGELHSRGVKLCENQICFYVQLLGRIAFSGYSQLVWDKFTSRLFQEKQKELKSMIANVLVYPLQSNSLIAPQFELFSEPLYLPIFFKLKPSKNNGELIKSVLGNHILSNESFEYILCKKSIFQVNYKLDRNHQAIILFNIFAYLSCLVVDEYNFDCHEQLCGSPSNKNDDSNLLIKTLLEVARSWSNNTKILFRSYEQSRYLSSAFIIAFRYALEYDKQSLIRKSEDIQASIMQGFPIYLNRATSDYRHLALCIGETVLQALHELIDENSTKDQQKIREPLKLDFGIELNDVNLDMRRLFRVDIDEMFDDCKDTGLAKTSFVSGSIAPRNSVVSDVATQSNESTKEPSELTVKSRQHSVISTKDSKDAKRAIIVLDSDSDDLSPHEMSDDNDCDVDNGEVIGDDFINIPIYLQDCIDGLAENKNPRYMRLCLIKAGELISQLSQEQAAAGDKLIGSSEQRNRLQCSKANDSIVNDAIRDNSRELAQLLLYLDDQYLIEDFDALRMNAISSLCVAAPDLVVKYLLDEFNGSHRSTRHQLDILQALVASARQLSGCPIEKQTATVGSVYEKPPSTNKFVKYVPLYFYGIVHTLKADLSYCISPATIVSAAKSQGTYATASDKHGETMLRRVITGLANSKNQLSLRSGKNFLPNVTSIITTTTTTDDRISLEQSRRPAETKGQGDTELVKETSTKASSSGSATATTKPSEDSRLIKRHFMDDGRRLGDNGDRLDDSYLLSRIFFSISLIIECVNQQPIACKLSNDLIDILANYRHHPDSGVRKAIGSCLTVIRDYTPSVYFKEHLYDKLVGLFGDWLANELELLQLPPTIRSLPS